MWFAGVDWADTHHDLVIIDAQGRHISPFRVTPTAEGLSELSSKLSAVSGPQHKADLACMVETNHGVLITTRF